MTKYELRKKITESKPVDKEKFIQGICTGKTVLDLGCIRHSADFALADPNWLHKKIKSVATKIVGIDYLPKEIEKLNAVGYEIIYADVTKPMELNETFDVIVAGDLIEHLVNFEGFFENCIRLLKPNGMLIITTPNPFYAAEFHYVAFKCDYLINPEHTCWIDPQALSQLIDRFDCFIDEIYFIKNAWRLGDIVCNSEANEYDILNGKWPKNTFKDQVIRKIASLLFNIFYMLFKNITGSNAALVKYSDYLSVIKKRG
ncbi:MAG: methyltransferase domain-containing protein [Gallionellaceae bacterium]|jgi:SAM-dependent methyltransferase